MRTPILALLVFCFSALSAFSQLSLTWGQAYDFNVGDLFMYNGTSPGYPPTVHTYTVTGKSFSPLQDTVHYTYYRTSYTFPTCWNCPGIYDTLISGQWIVPNLADTIGADLGVSPQYSTFGCIDTTGFTGSWVDSVYLDSNLCNRLSIDIQTESNIYLDDSCLIEFEPIFEATRYAAGLGWTHSYYNAASQGCGSSCIYSSSMIFYIKGTDSCGLRFMVPIPVGTEDRLSLTGMSLSPNPFSSQARISFTESMDHATATLTNVLGETLWTQAFNGKELSVDGADLPSGAYFLRVESGGKAGVVKLLRE